MMSSDRSPVAPRPPLAPSRFVSPASFGGGWRNTIVKEAIYARLEADPKGYLSHYRQIKISVIWSVVL